MSIRLGIKQKLYQSSKADLNKFWHNVQNEVTLILICAKFGTAYNFRNTE